MWTTAFNTSFLLGYLLVDAASPSTSSPSSVPPLLEIANKHALLVFLLVNAALS
jgi:phosphatidylinositol glycan class W